MRVYCNYHNEYGQCTEEDYNDTKTCRNPSGMIRVVFDTFTHAVPFHTIKVVPVHEHDCECCKFLGTFDNHDLYFCNQRNRPTVIARWGSKGDYSSGLSFGKSDVNDMESPLGEAYRRAQTNGFIN